MREETTKIFDELHIIGDSLRLRIGEGFERTLDLLQASCTLQMRNPVDDLFEWIEMRWLLAGQFCKRMRDAKVHCEMHNPHIVTFNLAFGIATVSFEEDKIKIVLAEYSVCSSPKPLSLLVRLTTRTQIQTMKSARRY